MRTRIVKIGNSQGIRIPKALLAQTDLHGEVEISATRIAGHLGGRAGPKWLGRRLPPDGSVR